MTGLASELLVFTLERIVGLGFVIEGPQQPIVGVVAITALLTHTALVLILRFVTGETFDIRLLKLSAQVARLASGHTVDADEWKTGNVVFEEDPLIPSVFIVAITAVLPLLGLVHINRPVAVDAGDIT